MSAADDARRGGEHAGSKIEKDSLRLAPMAGRTVGTVDGKDVTIDDFGPVKIAELRGAM